MVYVEGYWKVRVVCLFILVVMIVVLWSCGGNNCEHEMSSVSVYATTLPW